MGEKLLNMHHQAQKGFCGIFIGISNNQKGYLVYVPHKCKIVSLYNVILNESFLLILRKRHNYIHKQWLCGRQCSTHRMLHTQSKKLKI